MRVSNEKHQAAFSQNKTKNFPNLSNEQIFLFTGVCILEPQEILNTNESRSGILDGDAHAYNCSGEFMWTNGTSGLKNIYCMADGQWGSLSEECKSLLIQLLFNFF